MDRRRLIKSLGAAAFTGSTASLLPSNVLGEAVFKKTSDLKPGQFTWHPERSPDGPVAIIVSLPDQRVHVYRNGIRIGVSTCSTGKPGHATPTGIFTILEKDKHHHSSTYNNAPMPNMNRLTWSGVALHAGNLPGYPASHGCVRLPMKFSELLFGITHVGTPVIIAGTHSDPSEVVHPGLVLADYASDEFDHAKSKLKGKEQPWAAHVTNYSGATSIIISSLDRVGILLVDGKVVGQATITIRNPSEPLGSHVFMLVDLHERRQGLSWHAISHHERSGVPVGQPEESIITRISAPENARQTVHEYMHPGMTLVTTDLPVHPNTRTDQDFVVMTQATS